MTTKMIAHAATRWLAVGDPQSSPERFFDFLERGGAITTNRPLAPDVGLVSIGDHFDYGSDAAVAPRDGLAILQWLASQPAAVLIAGNHDLCRVNRALRRDRRELRGSARNG